MLKRAFLPMPHSFQGGAALLIFLTIIILGGAYLLVSSLKSARLEARKDNQTAQALAQAKESLLAFATLYPEAHSDMPVGYLPCPDSDGDGSAELSCGLKGQNVIGRLPWRTLKLPPLRDGDGECLWYAVSGTYKYNPQWALSSDTDGLFLVKGSDGSTIIGASNVTRAIAVVFAPGKTINNQNRAATPAARSECGSTLASDGINNATNYLDVLGNFDNARGTETGAGAGLPGSAPLATIPAGLASVFVQAPEVKNALGITFNDSLVALTPTDYDKIFARMDQWVAQRVSACLQAYGDANSGLYPWQSTLVSPGDYFDDNSMCYGRVANAIGIGSVENLQGLSNTVASNGALRARWENFPGVGRCFYEAGATSADWWWWSGWKDQVFIAIDPNFAPQGSGDLNDVISQLQLDGSPQEGVVMVAGRRLPGQDRAPGMGSIGDYLEDANGVWSDYSFTTRASGTGPFNDVVLPFNSAAGGGGGGMMGGMGCGACTCGMCDCSPGMSGME